MDDKQDNRGFEPTIRLRIEPTMLANWSPEQTGTATVSAADLRATIEEYTRRFREAWVSSGLDKEGESDD